MPRRLDSFIDQDDLVIKDMEKKLKLKKRKKLPKSFYEQGLGDILDFVDSITGPSSSGTKRKKRDLHEDLLAGNSSDEETFRESDDEEKNQIAGEDVEQSDDGQELQTEEQVMAALKRHRESKAKEKPERKNKQKDLYGFETGQINKDVSNAISQTAPAENKDLMRQIRGQLNRLTTSSLPSISTLIEGIYAKNSLFQVNETICKIISDLVIIEPTLSPLSLICEMSLMLATLNENVGDEVGGHAVNYFVKIYHKLLKEEPQDESCKKLDNVVALLCYIYAVGLVDASLFVEIINQMVNVFDGKSIELIMFVLTAVGFIIRKESPELMKKLIIEIQSKANSVSTEQFGKRIEFMLETLTEIKNNNILKVTSKSSSVVNPISREDLRNILKNSLKRSCKVTPLRGSFGQVLSSNRWWVKVGSLIETSDQKSDNRKKEMIGGGGNEESSEFNFANQFTIENEREEKICRSLRLNTTALRRSLFKAIITSSDYIEASDRLVAMCRKNQAPEAANVLIQIAIHEKNVNMFYIHTLKRLSNFDRRYKFSIFLAIKDRLKDLSGLNARKRSTLCHLILELLKFKVVSLAVLKVFDFASITEDANKMELMKQILTLVMQQDEQVMKDIFDSIPKKEHQLVASIKYFISCFLDESAKSSKTRDLLIAKLKLSQQMKKQAL